ncbi:MAG: hypothetical protein A2W91_14685 [Bacteroidetes bacterium GWF2_38_335]|nr:MAG: hypothetical protein A2W91_14685 [Bacteroidetes bacterium GWF2_38_335]OFY78449.1 MAG: hypothetical protein A2281_15995 [Bacteroidetes bacterium RIFOXYA12_FULL_38_20]HBS88394.1 efflux RND transporter periplasmic adaptor subunit [Bacteroidales bacterium]
MKKRKNNKLRYFVIIAVVLVILLLLGKKSGCFGKEELVEVETEKPQKRVIVETITASGKIQPETEVKISPDVSGEIVELNVVDGQKVTEGDLLLKIRPDIYLSNLDRMKATVNSAKAQHEQARAQLLERESSYNRIKELYESKTVSKSEFEASESAYKVAKANADAANYSVKSSEASLNEAEKNLTKTSIYAPMSGIISALNVKKGERVVGTVQMAGTEMLRIADLTKMEVKVEVNENDIVKVSLGDTATIEIDAYLDHKFKGIVTNIANSANTTGIASDQVTSFDVKIRILPESYSDLLKQNEYPFRPGMSATVDIQTHTEYNVLSIPIQAVTTRSDSLLKAEVEKEEEGGEFERTSAKNLDEKDKNNEEIKEIVFIYEDGIVKAREVKTGIQDNNFIQILKGLSEKDEVVVAPYIAISKKLKDGLNVNKVEKAEIEKE